MTFALALATAVGADAAPRATHVTVDLAAGPTSRFTVDEALGAGVDGMPRGEVERLYTAHNIEAMRSAGLRPLTYRLRTELAIEAWHWNPAGTWSDGAHAQGYWTSSDAPGAPIQLSWGYRLPRRGDTVDQAGDAGFSRIDDGDPASFWKSNPYLDSRYADEDHPQWLVVDLGATRPVDAARIAWARPWANRFAVQYWRGADEYDDEGGWITFPGGEVDDGAGGAPLLRLASTPVRARWVRVLMLRSSGVAVAGGTDPRDAMGYAVAEAAFGVVGADGRLIDSVRHAPDRFGQSVVTVSSTDPWHRAVDRDPNLEQPGLDRVFAGGLTGGLPMMVPVGALYDTPDNAAAMVRYLRARGYPVRGVELGEEPDGQNVPAEDFAALYAQFAAAVHEADPSAVTGGPSLQDGISDVWLEAGPDRSWTRRFVGYLHEHGRLADLGFFSFERYPIDALCGDLGPKLRDATAGLAAIFHRLRHDDGVPAATPIVVTEYGLSAFGGEGEVTLLAALGNADVAAQSLTLGADGAYLFGYGPNLPFHHGAACSGDGELMTWEADDEGQARWPMPAYYAARLLTQDWAAPQGVNETFAAASGDRAVAAYAVRRPDHRLAVLLLNRAGAPRQVSLGLGSPSDETSPPGPLAVVQYGPDQYAWRAAGLQGRPSRDEPPRRFELPPRAAIDVPPWSLTVVSFAP